MKILVDMMKFGFKKSLTDIQKSNEAFLANYEKTNNKNTTRLSTRIDPRQVSIVAFLRDPLTLEVLQAVQVNAKSPADRGPR